LIVLEPSDSGLFSGADSARVEGSPHHCAGGGREATAKRQRKRLPGIVSVAENGFSGRDLSLARDHVPALV